MRLLRKNGAIANASCGIHVHVGATNHTAKTLRNLVNIMTEKEDILFKALEVSQNCANRWSKNGRGVVANLNRKKPTTESGIERLWYNGASRRTTHYDISRYHTLNLHSLWQGKGIEFICFNGTNHAGKIKTYIQLCLAISHQALTQNAASARQTAGTNEKYTMRTLLLRIGMIGDEFKTARQFLLEKLNGTSPSRTEDLTGWPHNPSYEIQGDKSMKKRLYVAYGSNLNQQQMARGCPTAKVFGIGKIKNYQLTFRCVATIEPEIGKEVPVGVWEIQPRGEAALDRYKGYPNLYRKEDIQVTMSDGTEVTAMVYIMNRGFPDYPNASYYRTIEEGYHDCGLDPQYLKGALEDTEMRKKKQ